MPKYLPLIGIAAVAGIIALTMNRTAEESDPWLDAFNCAAKDCHAFLAKIEIDAAKESASAPAPAAPAHRPPDTPPLLLKPDHLKVAYIGSEVVPLHRLTYGADINPPLTEEEQALLRDYKTAERCASASTPKNDAQMIALEPIIEKAQAERGLANAEEMKRYHWELYERCKGITPQHLDDALVRLSQSNHPTLRYQYALAIRENNPEAARIIFEQEWERTGSILTLGQLSGVSQSLSLSLAYFAAMIAADFTPSGVEHFRKLLAEAQNSASLSELPTATQQAAQILRSPICCTFP